MDIVRLGIALILLGFLLIFASAVTQFMAVQTQAGGVQAGAAGCVIILFIPVCFGLGSPNLVTPLIVLVLLTSLAFAIVTLMVFRKPAANAEVR